MQRSQREDRSLKHNLAQTLLSLSIKILLLISAISVLSACNPNGPDVTVEVMGPSDEKIVNSVTINHVEIRRDILAELQKREVQYWINEDNSIGFPPADAEIIDSIYYEVVGAYAARN